MDKRVKKLPARYGRFDEKLKVCAYVRVSTGHEKQLDSLKNQTEYYRKKLSNLPGYLFTGIYSDSDISGAKENRPGFLAMMDAARNGKVDIIYTKSLSRFARNVLLLLNSIRELNELGVRIIFEKDNLDTMSAQGELAVTIMAAIAEEERKNVSENIKWTIRSKFTQGRMFSIDTNRLLGYDKTEDKELIINEEEAVIVRMIFELYLSGLSSVQVAMQLNNLGIPSYKNHKWVAQRVLYIISNEKYTGDLLLQKSYVNKMGKQVPNTGQKPKYLVRNNHPAIISRETWNRAQEIRAKRRRHR